MSTEDLSKTFEISIQGLANSGDGVGRLENKVVFVPYAAPGDRLKIQITKNKKNFARAQIVEILEPSPLRQEAPCRYFGTCGGCDWQHLPYADQLRWKKTHLKETLEKVGGFQNLQIEDVAPCPTPFNYRNRIQGQIQKGKFYFHKKGSSQKIPVDACQIADPRINGFIKNKLGSGSSGKTEIALVDGEAVSLPITSDRSTELGFRQVNDVMSAQLTKWCLEVSVLSKGLPIVDLYCGRGSWTNQLAQKNPDVSVIGVDILPENIRAGIKEAKDLKLNNVRFVEGDVEAELSRLSLKNSLCIVDPPRAGLSPGAIQALTSQICDQLIYISCHPATLARDLKQLVGPNYSLEKLRPLDMFPQTAHLETWALLRGNQP